MDEKKFHTKSILTKREKEVFELLVQDKTTKEIATDLFISEKTVRNHISNAMQKLGVKGRSQAVVELIRTGEWKRPGVNNVEEFNPDPFMEQLNKQGLPWHEEFDKNLEL